VFFFSSLFPGLHGMLIRAVDLGVTQYESCWDLQRQLFDQRLAGSIPDTLLLTQHLPVYTIGKTGDPNHLLANLPELREKGIAFFNNDRGGDVTFHGPGQLVGYPILDLHQYYLDLHRYLRDIESVVINVLSRFGIRGSRIEGYTGVWVSNDKICAIGIKSSRWVTMHGFALNVCTDLKHFDRIIPCGIFEKGVTSMRDLLGREVTVEDVIPELLREFAGVFHVDVERASINEICTEGGIACLQEPRLQ
jgi:lipoyl(octanoyl) transferase